MPVMLADMPWEARCQENRGINAGVSMVISMSL